MENVFDIAKSFMKNPRFVRVEHYVIQEVAKNFEKPKPFKEEVRSWLKVKDGIKRRLMMELIMDSINYCYWYGKHDIRPNGASATTTKDIIEKVFYRIHIDKNYNEKFGISTVDNIFHQLSIRRYPLLTERYKHMMEIVTLGGVEFVNEIEELFWGTSPDYIYKEKIEDGFRLFNKLITQFPGYGDDVFLKRASLFFIQLNRMFGKMEKFVNTLPVPADYQVPRALHELGCISYHNGLKEEIENSVLIPKNSLEECEIRAATILACKSIQDFTGYSISDIDTWLWLAGRKIEKPFHLTITTDY